MEESNERRRSWVAKETIYIEWSFKLYIIIYLVQNCHREEGGYGSNQPCPRAAPSYSDGLVPGDRVITITYIYIYICNCINSPSPSTNAFFSYTDLTERCRTLSTSWYQDYIKVCCLLMCVIVIISVVKF